MYVCLYVWLCGSVSRSRSSRRSRRSHRSSSSNHGKYTAATLAKGNRCQGKMQKTQGETLTNNMVVRRTSVLLLVDYIHTFFLCYVVVVVFYFVPTYYLTVIQPNGANPLKILKQKLMLLNYLNESI